MTVRVGNVIGERGRHQSQGILTPSEPVFITPQPHPAAGSQVVEVGPSRGNDARGRTPKPRRRHHRWPWIVGALVLLVAVGTGVIWLTSSQARPVTLRQAETRLGTGAADSTGAPGATRPAPGVYQYMGSGTEKLSLPPLSQAEGPSMPGTVTLRGSNCFVFRIDYSTHHWQTWEYCLHNGDLWEAGGQSWQLWSIGPLKVTNLSTFTCAPRSMALPAQASLDKRWVSSCTGTNTSVKGQTVSTGPYQFKGLTTMSVGGTRSPSRALPAAPDRLGCPARHRALRGVVQHEHRLALTSATGHQGHKPDTFRHLHVHASRGLRPQVVGATPLSCRYLRRRRAKTAHHLGQP